MKSKLYKFYDTCSLLLSVNTLFNDDDYGIALSSVTLNELERIKTSTNKDPDVKYAARKLLHLLDEHPDKYDCWIFRMDMLQPIIEADLEITDDTKILACALDYDNRMHPDSTIFVTNDLALKNIANLFFGTDSIESVNEDKDLEEYQGFEDYILTDDEMCEFYSHPHENTLHLLINQYVIIRNINNEIVDTLCWTGEEYRHLTYGTFKSSWFGEVKPIKGDVYQSMLADSLINNKITMVKGPAGSGKTFLSLSYLFHLFSKGKIDRIIVFCNTVATKGSAKLGYYPGTRDEKLLDSQIGNVLSSKLGDKLEVEHLIQQNALTLVPLSDIRGYDTSGMKAGIYISEAQNMDISLMKLALQRVGDDSICIIDGDCKTQVDDIVFAGANNGMRRASKIFRDHDLYGEITLQKIYRSEIAEIAEQM